MMSARIDVSDMITNNRMYIEPSTTLPKLLRGCRLVSIHEELTFRDVLHIALVTEASDKHCQWN